MLRHTSMKLQSTKVKGKLLRESLQKKTGYLLENENQSGFDFLSATLNAERQWNSIFKFLRENNFDHRILYPAKPPVKQRKEKYIKHVRNYKFIFFKKIESKFQQTGKHCEGRRHIIQEIIVLTQNGREGSPLITFGQQLRNKLSGWEQKFRRSQVDISGEKATGP